MSATVEGLTMADIFTRSHLQGEMDQYRISLKLTVDHQFCGWGVHIATATQVIKISPVSQTSQQCSFISIFPPTAQTSSSLNSSLLCTPAQEIPKIKQPKIPKTPKINQVEAHQEWWHSWTKEEWWILQLEQGVQKSSTNNSSRSSTASTRSRYKSWKWGNLQIY